MTPSPGNVDHLALIAVKVYSSEGLALSKSVLKDLSEFVAFDRVSSIYKVRRSERKPFHNHDLRKVTDFEGLSFALLAATRLPATELMANLYDVEKNHSNEVLHRSLSLNLLAYEDKTTMTADLTLPHPEFHGRPEVLFPAAEVWGDYFHPVLKKSLHELTREFANLKWGEFYEQGKSLLDF